MGAYGILWWSEIVNDGDKCELLTLQMVTSQVQIIEYRQHFQIW
jgi:hypothetical protein